MANEPRRINEILRANAYPGRGIIIGASPDGASAVFAYFIMGRSENSRNRVFAQTPDGIRTQAHDTSKMTDPSLIIYSPVRAFGDTVIVSNGDQTDTIYDALATGGSFENALATRQFEPDAPNFTPRISGVLEFSGGYSYKLGILKRAPSGDCLRETYPYSPTAGAGHFIHTYDTDGSPLPSFSGEPKAIFINDNIDDFTALLWDSLDEENKVSLYVSYINLTNCEKTTRIVNKNGGTL